MDDPQRYSLILIVDIIYLHGLKVDCVIGVWEWERRITQSITIDLDMGFDTRLAAASDSLEDTLSYKDVSKRVEQYVKTSENLLVERLAQEVADILLTEFEIRWCRVKINKFGAVRGARDVGIIIERGEKG